MKRWFFAALLILFALALGVGTPAGTEIRNQASASYVDSAGRPQTTTSNEVVTVVQPVYNFEIKPDSTNAPGEDGFAPGQSQTALAGAPVYFHYTVTNTGNTEDTIALSTEQEDTHDDFSLANPKTYLDANCNGQVDPGEAEVSSVTLAADASACLIVEAGIPAGQEDGDKAYLNLKGESQGDSNKKDEDNWAEAVATSQAVMSVTKGASASGEVSPGSEITYTIVGQNTGGSAAGWVDDVVAGQDGIFISDAIPDHTTYKKGSLTATAGAGTVELFYKTASGWTTTEPDDASTVEAVGVLIKRNDGDPDAFFPQGAQVEVSFTVVVNEGVSAGETIANQALVQFDATGDHDDEDEGERVTTNTTTNPVAATPDLLNGPYKDPDSDGSGFTNTYTDPTGTTWSYEETLDTDDPRDDDAEKVKTPVYGGDAVYFPFTLKNKGNAPDTFTLSVEIEDPNTGDDADPTRWSCQVLAADGTTPLSGPVGPLAAGEELDYVVKCTIPADYEDTDSTHDAARIVVTAASVTDPTKTNKVAGIVPDVQPGYGVDVDHNPGNNNGASGDGDPPAKTANPGDTVLFPFDVHNTGNNPDTYNLTAQVPEGFPATIYPDEDCDGEMDTPTPAPVTDTGSMDPGERKCFILGVSVPEGHPPINLDGKPGTRDDNIKITATSNADPDKRDTISTDLEVNPVAALAFTPDRSGTVTSPGTIVYTHTLKNEGNLENDDPDDPQYVVRFEIKGSTHPDWGYQIKIPDDPDSDWMSPGDAVTYLQRGESKEVQVQVIVPDGEPVGAVDQVQVEAKWVRVADREVLATASVTDTTTVVGGELRLEKSARTCGDADCRTVLDSSGAEAKPGDYIEYKIVATNIGTADLEQVIVSDPLPSYTEFVQVSATTTITGGQVVYSTDGSSWQSTPPSTLATGQSIFVAVDTTNDDNITRDDRMPPGTKIEITFVVRVK